MTPSRIRKLSALTRGAAILGIGVGGSVGVVGGCAKSEPIVNAPESSVSTTPSTDTPMALPPRVILNAPPQMPPSDDDSGSPVRRLNLNDGGRRLPPMNAPPRMPPTGNNP
jgi:hypothetical protein